MRSLGSYVRIQSVEEVRASLDTFGGGVADILEREPPGLPAFVIEPGFSYRALFQDIGSRLATVQEMLVEAEDAHVRNQIQLSRYRRESERLTTDLYNEQVAVRRTLSGLFGPDHGFEVAAFRGETPRELQPLSDQVDQTIKILWKPEVELPPAAAAGFHTDLGATAASLESGLTKVRLAGRRIARARKAADKTVIVKRKATAVFDGVFPWAAQTAEGLFRLAGEKDLADRIRTSRRRVTRRQAVEAEEGEADEPASDGSEAQETAPSSSEAEEEALPSSDS